MVRTTHLIFQGRLREALAVNPFDALFLVGAIPAALGLWAANRLRGISLRIELSRRERLAAWVTLAVLVAANWAYVLATQL